MVSVFPQLFTWGLIAPLLIRLAVAGVFGYAGVLYLGTRSPRAVLFGLFEIAFSLLLLVGLWTQVAAVAAALAALWCGSRALRHKSVPPFTLHVYILLLVMSVSLLFIGPGFFAFDLPL